MAEPKWYYAVHRTDFGDYTVSPIPGVYTTWEQCKKEVTGHNNCKYKKFRTLTESKYFVKSGKFQDNKDKVNKPVAAAKKGKEKNSKPKAPVKDRSANGVNGANDDGDEDDLSDLSDNEDHKTHRIDLDKFKFIPDPVIEVWTDGSSLGNGQKGCKAGYGVFFGQNDPRNMSKPVQKDPSNNRAELLAIKKALEYLAHELAGKESTIQIKIYTDSEYSINCVTHWVNGWIKNGWKTKSGSDVKNKKLIQNIQTLRKQLQVEFIHVRAHKKAPPDRASKAYKMWYGNFMADYLAVEGAKKSK